MMGEEVTRTSRTAPFLDFNLTMNIRRLQSEFGRALHFYQECMQKLKLDPENAEYKQNVAESQRQIVAIDLKQKLFVKEFRQKSHKTPKSPLSEKKITAGQATVLKTGGGSNETSDGGCSNHYTPPNSEDEHSDVSRSLSTGSGVSICADSISCPSSVSNTPLSSRPSSPSSLLVNSKLNHPVFPSDVMEQEEFLKGFGLITHESLKSQSETKRVERRRRTTANPKYNSNGFVDLSQISRRTRRMEDTEVVGGSAPKRMTLMASVKSKYSQPRCMVCEQADCNLTCESCQSQLHVDCIRVSGSKAPAPTRLQQCPRCIVAMNESRRFANSNEDYVKFQKPLIPTTPIIPANLKKKSVGSVSADSDQNSPSSFDVKTSGSTKSKIGKKTIPGKTVNGKSKQTSHKASSLNKEMGLKVSSDSTKSAKVDRLGKPVFASPFKSLTALTAKGAAANAAAKSEGNSLSNGGDVSVNGNHTVIPSVKKKSKLNGVKAKTLSLTGSPTNSNGTSKLNKPKASPLNNVNSNGNIGHSKPSLKQNRLSKFSADQHLSVEKTILAMTAAAKSVMSGMRLLPVSMNSAESLPVSNKDSSQSPPKALVLANGVPNAPSSSSSSSSPSSKVSQDVPAPPTPPPPSPQIPSAPVTELLARKSSPDSPPSAPPPTINTCGSELKFTETQQPQQQQPLLTTMTTENP